MSSTSTAPFALVVIQGEPEHLGRIFYLHEGVYTIGRTEQADIRLNELTISRRHAQLEVKDGQICIQDLESTCGIEVNGEMIRHATQLPMNVHLRIGQLVLKLMANAAPEQPLGCTRTIHDELTGTLNRRALLDALDEARAQDFALLVTDIDAFARLNYEHGHSTGDEVLWEIGARIKEIVASIPQASLGRVAGDSFAIVLTKAGEAFERAREVGETLVAKIEQRPFMVNGLMLDCTISVGVLRARGGEKREAKALLEEAMEAIYKAKEMGGNRVVTMDIDDAGTAKSAGSLKEQE